MFTAPKQEAGFCQPKDNLINVFKAGDKEENTSLSVCVIFPGMTLLGIVKEKKSFQASERKR